MQLCALSQLICTIFARRLLQDNYSQQDRWQVQLFGRHTEHETCIQGTTGIKEPLESATVAHPYYQRNYFGQFDANTENF